MSLGASSIPADWILRVFELSGIIDRPSDHISVRTIPMSESMDIYSRYNP